MLEQVINFLNVKDNLTYIDATFGRGGYSDAILNRANCNLIAIDQDPDVILFGDKLKKKYKHRFSLFSDSFNNIISIIKKKNLDSISGGIVADLGLSTMQIENANRGFSFMRDGPLDMRMSKQGETAKDIIYTANKKELESILKNYGEEKKYKSIAKLIVDEREKQNIDRTLKLVDLIKKAKKNSDKSKIHPATKTFQALRIKVNEELKMLDEFLKNSQKILSPGARLVLVTFHSLEDRIVKIFFNKITGKEININRHLPSIKVNKKIKFKKINKKPIVADKNELKKNFKARSAKMRVVERLDV